MSNPWPIPATWHWSTMGEVADVVGGGTPSTERAEFFGGNISWITPADLSGYNEKFISKGARNITQAGLDNSGACLMPAGTVLFSSRAPIGYMAIAANPVSTNQGFKSFVLRDNLTPDYVYYYLQHAKKLAIEMASGTTFLEISGKKAAQIPIPVPPLDEQRLIVAEIEKQFTRLVAGVTALKRTQANLKHYRAAVLKAACEGSLVPTEVELARKEGRDFETGEQLLSLILEERRNNWNSNSKYVEPVAPVADILPNPPDAWTTASLEQLTAADRVICYGILMPKNHIPGGVPYVKVRDMKNDKIDFSALPRTSPEIAAKYARASLKTGDILLAIRGTYGRVAEVPPELNGGNITQDTARLAVTQLVDRHYIAWFLRSEDAQKYFKRVARGVAVKGVNIGDVRPCPILLPPLTEQKRIVAEVDRRLSVVEELEGVVSANIHRASRLRQAVLARLFSGGMTSS